MTASAQPVISVIVAIVSDTMTGRGNTAHLMHCLQSLEAQRDAPAMEVIIPHHTHMDGIAAAKNRFPWVTFLAVQELARYSGYPGNREHHNELRARGIESSRGEIIALMEDHGVADEHWAARMVDAHSKTTAAAVGGAIENAVHSAINQAVCLCDFYRFQNPIPVGISADASDANVSYKRDALFAVRSAWQTVFNELAVNHALRERGQEVVLSPGVVVFQNRLNLSIRSALAERFVWGRSYGADRGQRLGAARILYAGVCLALPFLLLARIGMSCASKGRLKEFVSALPVVGMLLVAWSTGECAGYIAGLGAPGVQTREAAV